MRRIRSSRALRRAAPAGLTFEDNLAILVVTEGHFLRPANSILLGQYRPLNTWFHRLDPRALFLPLLLLILLGLFSQSLLFYAVALAAVVIGLRLAGFGARDFARNLPAIVIMVAITALYHLLFSGVGGPVIVSILGREITVGVIHSASLYSMRILLFVCITALVMFVNSPSDMVEAVVKVAAPLRRLRVPVDDLAMILIIALRFIPVLYGEVSNIKRAQQVRGVRFTGSLLTRVRRSTALLVPAFAAALRRADSLALAMMARGYESGQRRTFYSHLSFGGNEVVCAAAGVSFVVILFILTGRI